jgi:hypothetical protein
VAFTTFLATMGPSDSLSTRRDFALGLYPPSSLDVSHRGGSPQFRIRLSLRAVLRTPEASWPPPVPRASLLPSPRHDGLGHFPFRVPISRGCKVHALAFGPQVCPPRRNPTVPAGPSTLRIDVALSDAAWSLLRGAPALTAAGLPPASLMQHLGRTVQARPRSRRTTPSSLARRGVSGPCLRLAEGSFSRKIVWWSPTSTLRKRAESALSISRVHSLWLRRRR